MYETKTDFFGITYKKIQIIIKFVAIYNFYYYNKSSIQHKVVIRMTSDFISKLTNEYNQRNQDKTTISIRLSVKEDMILHELANMLDITRQDIISKLIQDYVVAEWERQRNEDKAELSEPTTKSDNEQFYLLNTNRANDMDDHDFMITHQVAAAFEDGYKEKINRIKAGDYVFLYASNQGIVAYGRASGVVEKRHHYGVEDKTFFQQLENFQELKSPITARQIKSVLGRSFPFAQTLSRIADGDKLLQYIKKEHQ